MRSIDERVVAVQRRSKRLKHHRFDRVLAALVFLLAFPLVDLAGRHATSDFVPSASDLGLFGASSLFGPSIGGYVLVAVVAAVVAGLVVMLLTARRNAKHDEEENPAQSEETEYQKEF